MSILEKAVSPDGTTHYVKQLQLIAGLLGRPLIGQRHKVFLTSSDWSKVAGEITRQYADSIVDPTKAPTPENFKSAEIGGVLFINAGTEDVETVAKANAASYSETGFEWKRDNLKSGRA